VGDSIEGRGCSYGELPGNIHSTRHRQIGSATGEIAHRGIGEVAKLYLQKETVGTSREEIAHRGREKWERLQL
jgi:hypothetical protein